MAKVTEEAVGHPDGIRGDTIWSCEDKPGHKFIRRAGERNVFHDIHILVADEMKALTDGKCPLC